MSQPIALGTVLGGRYQVTASLLTSADDDHVLQGEDQILRRRVSILVPGDDHEQLMVANARSLASGSGNDRFQILDLGQTQDSTYVVTSYAPAADLLDTLLVAENELEDESLSDDIFGDSRSNPVSPYVYEEPDPTQPHQAVAATGSESASDSGSSTDTAGPGDDAQAAAQPAVTKWSDDEYDAYENAPAAPSVRNKLGRARKVNPESTRSTLFDRAAAGGSGAAVGASAAAASKIDPTYDGDNRYESFEANEGKPERLTGYPVIEDETPGQDRSGAATPAGAAAMDQAIDRGEEPVHEDSDDNNADRRHDRGEDGSAHAAGGSAALGAGAAGAAGSAGGSGAGHDPGATADPEKPGKKRNGPLRALLLLLLILALLAAVVFGFRALGSLTSQFGSDDSDPAPQGEQTTSAPQETQAADAEGDQAEPQPQAVTRVTSDPNFMTDTDATLDQAIDGNPATYWLSYGFSNAAFGNLTDYVGLAVELEEPAPVSEITIDQSSGSGGNFNVYVSDSPSMDGAQQVGTGSFTGPQITVPLNQTAQDGEHQYVLVVWDQLPQLTNPIGGYQHGLRIGEVSVE